LIFARLVGPGFTDKMQTSGFSLYWGLDLLHIVHIAGLDQLGSEYCQAEWCPATEIPYQCLQASRPFQPGPTINVLSGPCPPWHGLPRIAVVVGVAVRASPSNSGPWTAVMEITMGSARRIHHTKEYKALSLLL